MPAAELPPCVFCGEPIGPGEETAGRAPMAAHAVCADAALADDEHWDAISAAHEQDDASRPSTVRRGGCLGAMVALLIAVCVPLALAAALP